MSGAVLNMCTWSPAWWYSYPIDHRDLPRMAD
jgi:hypothetical protein